MPGAASPEQVVAVALDCLTDGPTVFATDDVRAGAEAFASMTRNEAARLMVEVAGGAMGPGPEGGR